MLLPILFELQSEFQIFHDLERFVNIPVPEIPFEAFEVFSISALRFGCSSASLLLAN